MLIIGRVVGEPIKKPWEPKDKPGTIVTDVTLSILDKTTKTVLEVTYGDAEWKVLTDFLHQEPEDNMPLEIPIRRARVDQFGKLRLTAA